MTPFAKVLLGYLAVLVLCAFVFGKLFVSTVIAFSFISMVILFIFAPVMDEDV